MCDVHPVENSHKLTVCFTVYLDSRLLPPFFGSVNLFKLVNGQFGQSSKQCTFDFYPKTAMAYEGFKWNTTKN